MHSERFRREIQLVAGLQHPYIVPVLGTREASSAPSTPCRSSKASRSARTWHGLVTCVPRCSPIRRRDFFYGRADFYSTFLRD